MNNFIRDGAGLVPDKPIVFSTYVFGELYQNYIPVLLYSLLKAYPKCVPILFLQDQLVPNVRRSLSQIEGVGEFKIIERYLETSSWKTHQHAEGVRWLLWDADFKSFDSIYLVDADMIYVREEQSIYQQHTYNAGLLGVPWSNQIRGPRTTRVFRPRYLRSTVRARMYYHLLQIIRHGNFPQKRLTGLHFMEMAAYEDMLFRLREKFLSYCVDGACFAHHEQGFSDEYLLYDLIEEAGLMPHGDAAHYALVKRPTHGLHLGDLRGRKTLGQTRWLTRLNQIRKQIPHGSQMLRDLEALLPEMIGHKFFSELSPIVQNQVSLGQKALSDIQDMEKTKLQPGSYTGGSGAA